jgi:hypothetical protein
MSNMEKPQTAIYAVITGDIVGSTKLSPKQLVDLRKTLDEAVRVFSKRNDECVFKAPEFFRGDSWQVLLNKPGAALNLALLIQASFIERGVQTRAAIGIGTVASLDKTIATSTGEAFALSGRALENITGNVRLSGALPAHARRLEPWFQAILRISGGLASSWTRRQAEAMRLWLSLVNPTHEAIAQQLQPPVTKQSVGDILTSANWHYLNEGMKAFHATGWQFLDAETGKKDAGHTAGEQKSVSRHPRKKRQA